jgi:hypothetical protein
MRLAMPNFHGRVNVWFFTPAHDGCSNFLCGGSFYHGLTVNPFDTFRTERAFLKSERRNIFVEARDFRNAR